jgi:hypothetical protein
MLNGVWQPQDISSLAQTGGMVLATDPPSGPNLDGRLWLNTADPDALTLYAWHGGAWQPLAGSGGGPVLVPTVGVLTQTLPTLAQQIEADAVVPSTVPTIGVLAQHLPALTQTLAADASASTVAALAQTLPEITQAVTANVQEAESEIVWWTDFSDMTTDAFPSGMTVRLDAGTSTWRVREKTGTTGGKTLEFTGSTSGNRMIAVDAAGLVDDDVPVEVVAKVRTSSVLGIRLGAAARAEADAATFYTVRPGSGSATLQRYNAGTSTALHGGSLGSITAGEWYWTRLRVEGSSIKARFWNDSDAEPGSWSRDDTDSSPLTNAGYAGLFLNGATGTQDVDVLGVAVGGPSAPKADPNL